MRGRRSIFEISIDVATEHEFRRDDDVTVGADNLQTVQPQRRTKQFHSSKFNLGRVNPTRRLWDLSGCSECERKSLPRSSESQERVPTDSSQENIPLRRSEPACLDRPSPVILAQSKNGKFAALFNQFGLGEGSEIFRLFFNFWLLPRLLPGCLFWLLLFGLALSYCGEQKATEHRPANTQNRSGFHTRGINER